MDSIFTWHSFKGFSDKKNNFLIGKTILTNHTRRSVCGLTPRMTLTFTPIRITLTSSLKLWHSVRLLLIRRLVWLLLNLLCVLLLRSSPGIGTFSCHLLFLLPRWLISIKTSVLLRIVIFVIHFLNYWISLIVTSLMTLLKTWLLKSLMSLGLIKLLFLSYLRMSITLFLSMLWSHQLVYFIIYLLCMLLWLLVNYRLSIPRISYLFLTLVIVSKHILII